MAPVTTDHNTIRRSAEKKHGKPAAVKPTHRGGDLGIVRIMVPDRPRSDDKDLVGIAWEESASRSGRTAIAACCLSKKIRPAGAGRRTRVRRQTGMIATMRNVFGSMIKISSRTMMNL
jgi:hypothetical protein